MNRLVMIGGLVVVAGLAVAVYRAKLGAAVAHPLRGAWDVLRHDANFRKLAVVVMLSAIFGKLPCARPATRSQCTNRPRPSAAWGPAL